MTNNLIGMLAGMSRTTAGQGEGERGDARKVGGKVERERVDRMYRECSVLDTVSLSSLTAGGKAARNRCKRMQEKYAYQRQ